MPTVTCRRGEKVARNLLGCSCVKPILAVLQAILNVLGVSILVTVARKCEDGILGNINLFYLQLEVHHWYEAPSQSSAWELQHAINMEHIQRRAPMRREGKTIWNKEVIKGYFKDERDNLYWKESSIMGPALIITTKERFDKCGYDSPHLIFLVWNFCADLIAAENVVYCGYKMRWTSFIG